MPMYKYYYKNMSYKAQKNSQHIQQKAHLITVSFPIETSAIPKTTFTEELNTSSSPGSRSIDKFV